MRLLPFDRTSLVTSLTPVQVFERLQAKVKPHPRWRWAGQEPPAPWLGSFDKASFELCRGVKHVNSAIPFIFGEYAEESGKTIIRITMRPHAAVLVFAVFWTVGTSCFPVSLAHQILLGQRSLGFLLPSLIMVPVGYLFCEIAFWIEAGPTRKGLRELFDAQEEGNQ